MAELYQAFSYGSLDAFAVPLLAMELTGRIENRIISNSREKVNNGAIHKFVRSQWKSPETMPLARPSGSSN
jgi:hypothetical protein